MRDDSTHSDDQLLRLLKHGDEQAFSEIYNRYWKKMFYQAEAILAKQNLAEDCVQEVFLSLWRRREETEIDHLEAYLKRAVRLQALMVIRAKKVQRDYYNRIAAITSEFILHQPYLFKESENIFNQVLQSLPSDQQEIFELVRGEGLSYKEIAARKGISVKTVEKKMSLSLKEFRMRLTEFLHTFLFF